MIFKVFLYDIMFDKHLIKKRSQKIRNVQKWCDFRSTLEAESFLC